MKMQESLKCEREMEIVQFGQPAISYNSMAAFPWMITKNSISPELSMKLLTFQTFLHLHSRLIFYSFCKCLPVPYHFCNRACIF